MGAGTSLSSVYYNEISRTQMVDDPEEERRLIKRWQRNSDTRARDRVVQSHLRFVVKQAHKKTRDPEAVKDYIAAGNLGLLRAIEPGRFDPDRKPYIRFLTYAGVWIYKEMMDQDYASNSLVHVPTHRQKEQRRKAHAHTQAALKHGANSEQARATEFVRHADLVVAIDSVDDTELDNDAELANTYHQQQLRETLETALALLPSREALILRLHFGVKDEPRNLVQIAKLLEMTPERVRQIKVHGLQLLKDRLMTGETSIAADLAS